MCTTLLTSSLVSSEETVKKLERIVNWFLWSKETRFNENSKYNAQMGVKRLAAAAKYGGTNILDFGKVWKSLQGSLLLRSLKSKEESVFNKILTQAMKEIRISRRWDATIFNTEIKLRSKSWLQDICLSFSKVTEIRTNFQIGKFYGYHNKKMQITYIVKITQIVLGVDEFPLEAEREDGSKSWYGLDWLHQCETNGYELITPATEEVLKPLMYVNGKPLEKVRSKDVYQILTKNLEISEKALKNAKNFGWNLCEMFGTLKKLRIQTKIKNTWFQILHNSIKVMTNIHHENRDTLCPLCKKEDEDIEHLFGECESTCFIRTPNWKIWPTEKSKLANHLVAHYLTWKIRCEYIFQQIPIVEKERKNQLKKLQKKTQSVLENNPEGLEESLDN